MKKKWYVFLIVIAIFFYILYKVGTNKTEDMTTIEKVDEGIVTELSKIKNNDITDKTIKFIEDRLQNNEGYLSSHETDDENYSLSEIKKHVIEDFFYAIKEKDLDSLLGIFDRDSLSEFFGEEINVEERIDLLLQQLQMLDRGGELSEVKYQFHLEQYNQETYSGTMYFVYPDKEVTVPFDLNLYEHGPQRIIRFETKLTDITGHVLNGNSYEDE